MQFITKFLLLFTFITLLPLSSTASENVTLTDVISALEKSYLSLQDVHADFSQKTKIVSIGKEQKGFGEVMLKKPASSTSMFRFNYTKPKQQIISNGKQVWFYIPENRQVLISSVKDMFKGGNSIALSYLTGLGHVSKDFTPKFADEKKDKNGNYQIELTPKNQTPTLTKLSLTISSEAVDIYKKDGAVKDIFPIVSSIVHDAAGNQTKIDYSKIRVNSGISSNKFNFTTPENVQVIKQGGK